MSDLAIVRQVGNAQIAVVQQEPDLITIQAFWELYTSIPGRLIDRLDEMEPLEGLVEGKGARSRNESRDRLIADALGRNVMRIYERGERKNAVRALLFDTLCALQAVRLFGPDEACEKMNEDLKLRVYQHFLFLKPEEDGALPEDTSFPLFFFQKYGTCGVRGVASANPKYFEEVVAIILQ